MRPIDRSIDPMDKEPITWQKFTNVATASASDRDRTIERRLLRFLRSCSSKFQQNRQTDRLEWPSFLRPPPCSILPDPPTSILSLFLSFSLSSANFPLARLLGVLISRTKREEEELEQSPGRGREGGRAPRQPRKVATLLSMSPSSFRTDPRPHPHHARARSLSAACFLVPLLLLLTRDRFVYCAYRETEEGRWGKYRD